MGKIFINQDVLKVDLKYDELPGAVARVSIKYRNPERKHGVLTDDALHNEAGKSYYYVFEKGESLSMYGGVGAWKFWLFLELVDGRIIPGESVECIVYREGQ